MFGGGRHSFWRVPWIKNNIGTKDPNICGGHYGKVLSV